MLKYQVLRSFLIILDFYYVPILLKNTISVCFRLKRAAETRNYRNTYVFLQEVCLGPFSV